MNIKFFLEVLHKRTFGLAVLSLSIFSTTYSQQVVLNVLDRTKGEASLYFYQPPRTDNYTFIPLPVINKHIGQQTTLTDTTFQVSFIPNSLHSIISCGWLYNNKVILLTQGDSLNVIVDYSKKQKGHFDVVFKGKNEINYSSNTSRQIDEIDRSVLSKIGTTTDLRECLQIIDSAYNQRINMLNNLPSIYKAMRINEEKADYFYYLYRTLSDSNKKMRYPDILRLKNKVFSEKFESSSPYLMDDSYYRRGLRCLALLLCQGIQSENKLMASTDTINKYFEGEQREYLIADMFNRIYRSNSKEYNVDPDVETWYNAHKDKMQNKLYNEYISYTYDEYKKLNSTFSADILSEKAISLKDSSEISIGGLIRQRSGHPIIIDHWATWCHACIEEIILGKSNTEKLEETGVQFIYLSLDKMQDFHKAKQKAIELGIENYAYILSGNFDTKYIKHLKIASIPRYILLDAKGNILSTDLVRPREILSIDNFIKR